jgi:glycosyltransferase involved in cell wall biosynthesis
MVGRTGPRVSVVIPVFNSAAYLPQCLSSVSGQSLRDIEIICVDDGSTDGSAPMIQDVATRDQRVKYHFQENQGAGAARNRGLSLASGSWIYFLDSDDSITPNALEDLYRWGEANSLDVVYFDSVGKAPFTRGPISAFHKKRLEERTFEGRAYLSRAVKGKVFRYSPCMQFLRRSFLLDNLLNFPDQPVGEDVEFSIRTVLAAKRVSFIPRALFSRNLRPGSLTTATNPVVALRSSLNSVLSITRWLSQPGLAQRVKRPLKTLRTRLWKNALGYFDLLPPEVSGSLTGKNLVDSEPALGEIFLRSAGTCKASRRLTPNIDNCALRPNPHSKAN